MILKDHIHANFVIKLDEIELHVNDEIKENLPNAQGP